MGEHTEENSPCSGTAGLLNRRIPFERPSRHVHPLRFSRDRGPDTPHPPLSLRVSEQAPTGLQPWPSAPDLGPEITSRVQRLAAGG